MKEPICENFMDFYWSSPVLICQVGVLGFLGVCSLRVALTHRRLLRLVLVE